MIKVKILFFASMRSLTKKKSQEIELPEDALISDLKVELIKHYPRLERPIKATLAAVNREFANEMTALADGDEVALFSHVSGG